MWSAGLNTLNKKSYFWLPKRGGSGKVENLHSLEKGRKLGTVSEGFWSSCNKFHICVCVACKLVMGS